MPVIAGNLKNLAYNAQQLKAKNLIHVPLSNEEAQKRMASVVNSIGKKDSISTAELKGTGLKPDFKVKLPESLIKNKTSHKGIIALGALVAAVVAGAIAKKAVDAKKEAQPEQKLNANA